MGAVPGTPIVESDGRLVLPAATSQNHWWLLDYWDTLFGGSTPSALSGQFVAVDNTIQGLQFGDGILYLPINVAYGTSSINCVWFQFDVFFNSIGQVFWYIWDVNCPGTSLSDYHYTTLGLPYTVGDRYNFGLKTSGSNTVTFSINDTSTGSSWSNSRWLWVVPSTNLLALESSFSPASAVEGYTTNSSLTGVPLFESKMGQGISVDRNYGTGTGLPLGVATTRASLLDSSHYLWSMGPVAELSGQFCGSVGGADNLNCNGLTPTTIGLNWGESGYPLFCFGHYDVQESTTGPKGNWTTIDSQAPRGNTTDYVQNLKPGQTYWWREVDHGCLLSATSNVLQATQPVTATLSYRAKSDTAYQFSWNNNANYTGLVAFDSYQLEESINGGSYSLAQTIISWSSTNFTINGLSGASNYSFYLVTIDKCGTCSSPGTSSSNSNIVGFKTPPTLLTSAGSQRGLADTDQPVSFSCNASGGVLPYNYSWAFGDGSTGEGQTVTHSYGLPGTMNVECTVTDALQTNATGLPISVNIVIAPSIVIRADRSSADVGQIVVFTSQVTGGFGVYSFDWLHLPPGCGLAALASVTCQLTSIGSYAISLNVTDSNAFSVVSYALPLTVFADPSIAAFTTSPNNLDVGQSTTIVVLATRSNGALSYSYSGLPPGCTTSDNPTFTCDPSVAGHYSIMVTVTDSNGFTLANGPVSITVNPYPTITLQANPSGLDFGQSVTLTVSGTGGTGSFSYSYQTLPPGCSSTNTPNLTCHPSEIGTFTIQIVATDQLGGTAVSSVTLTVNSDPTISSFTPSSTRLETGQKLTLTVSASLGTGTLTYSYSGLPPGCVSADSASLSCTPSTAGNYEVQVTIIDQAGKTSKSSVSINVNPQTLLGLPLWAGYSVISGIVVAALAGSIGLLRSRKKRAQSKIRPVDD